MNNGTVSTEEFAVALMRCTGSVASTYDDGRGTVATAVQVEGVSVVLVDAKAELAEIMAVVESRKKFYNRAMASLRAIYAVEARDRDAVKAAKEALSATGYKRTDTMFATKQIEQLVKAEENLAETMAMVFERKKFFNRVSKSYQTITAVERRHRAAMKIVKAAK